ncbi:MAG TPA: hypothetical protein VFP97_17430, partial [Chitinophagaceae bacterium]|nr:hypothetical protein [Chitinophagaceae bacterium]
MKSLLLVTLTSTLTVCSLAQNPWELGAEYLKPIGKGYKSNIGALRYEYFSNKIGFSAGLTYHFSPRDAYSGFKGYGLFAGLRNYFGNNANGNNPFIG